MIHLKIRKGIPLKTFYSIIKKLNYLIYNK